MSSSTFPTAFTNLQALVAAALPDDVQSTRAPRTQQRRRHSVLWLANLNGPVAVPLEQNWAGSGPLSRNEKYTIPAVLESWSGSTNAAKTASLLSEAFTTFGLIEQVLRDNVSLGITGRTVRAQITAGSYSQSQEGQGLLCRITFEITVEARI